MEPSLSCLQMPWGMFGGVRGCSKVTEALLCECENALTSPGKGGGRAPLVIDAMGHGSGCEEAALRSLELHLVGIGCSMFLHELRPRE